MSNNVKVTGNRFHIRLTTVYNKALEVVFSFGGSFRRTIQEKHIVGALFNATT
jgi:hypothetical protein